MANDYQFISTDTGEIVTSLIGMYEANQNIPSRATGANLDAFSEKRPQEKPSTCTIRFHISTSQTSAILVPPGTRVTTNSDKIYWATEEDVYIAAGMRAIKTVAQAAIGVIGGS